MSFFTYHVQNRDYSKGEVLALLNDVSYKHHVLSGNQHWYSTATSLETIGRGFEFVGKGIAFILGVAQLAKDTKSIYDGEYGDIYLDQTLAGIHLVETASTPSSVNLHGTREFNIFQLPANSKFSGQEVTKLLSELGSDNWNWFVSKKNDIVSDFASHKYENAEVGTLDNKGWWEYAVLDANSSELVEVADISSVEA